MEFHRATTNIDENLHKLITEETDPSKRANLLVMSAMALNLSANTMALNALSTEIYEQKKEAKNDRINLRAHRVRLTVVVVVMVIVFLVAVWFK